MAYYLGGDACGLELAGGVKFALLYVPAVGGIEQLAEVAVKPIISIPDIPAPLHKLHAACLPDNALYCR